MEINFNVRTFTNVAPSILQQKDRISEPKFKGQNCYEYEASLNANIHKAYFLDINAIKKSNKVSFCAKRLDADAVAKKVADLLYSYRKQDSIKPCEKTPCPSCTELIKSKVLPFVENNETIKMLMICFPFKLPCRQKTLGPWPDKAEELSFRNLRKMMGRIEEIYKPEDKPGAKFTIYNDNLIFSEAELHPSDDAARTYQNKLKQMAAKIGVDDRIEFRTIEDVEFFAGTDAPQDLLGRRQWLRDNYGQEYTEDNLKRKMKESPHYNNFVNGIKRFNQEIMKGIFASAGEKAIGKEFDNRLIINVDDNNYIRFISRDNNMANDLDVRKAVDIINKVGQEALVEKLGPSNTPYVRISGSNGALRFVPTDAGKRRIGSMSYKVLHLDQSWVSFINANTKNNVRFSMHTQPCGSFKNAIELVPGSGWIQPWNSAAVDIGNENYILTKSRAARTLGCKLVTDPVTGDPSHYVLNPDAPNRLDIIKTLSNCTNLVF